MIYQTGDKVKFKDNMMGYTDTVQNVSCDGTQVQLELYGWTDIREVFYFPAELEDLTDRVRRLERLCNSSTF